MAAASASSLVPAAAAAAAYSSLSVLFSGTAALNCASVSAPWGNRGAVFGRAAQNSRFPDFLSSGGSAAEAVNYRAEETAVPRAG